METVPVQCPGARTVDSRGFKPPGSAGGGGLYHASCLTLFESSLSSLLRCGGSDCDDLAWFELAPKVCVNVHHGALTAVGRGLMGRPYRTYTFELIFCRPSGVTGAFNCVCSFRLSFVPGGRMMCKHAVSVQKSFCDKTSRT